MKKQNRKQGFTLVELLVVIAILAILATVSIVGYTAFIKKAHQSNANAEANQLKEAIRAELIAGNDFVLGEVEKTTTEATESTPATTTVKTCVIRRNGTEATSPYAVLIVTTVNGVEDETTTPALANDTQIKTALEANEDFNGLLEHGDFTVKADSNNGILVYNYTEYDGGITVEIDLNNLDK